MHLYNGSSGARRLRTLRLHRHNPRRILLASLDRPLTDGPINGGGAGLSRLVGRLAANGADAVVLHKGSVRHLDRLPKIPETRGKTPPPNPGYIFNGC